MSKQFLSSSGLKQGTILPGALLHYLKDCSGRTIARLYINSSYRSRLYFMEKKAMAEY
jgi:hypothetical protein